MKVVYICMSETFFCLPILLVITISTFVVDFTFAFHNLVCQ